MDCTFSTIAKKFNNSPRKHAQKSHILSKIQQKWEAVENLSLGEGGCGVGLRDDTTILEIATPV